MPFEFSILTQKKSQRLCKSLSLSNIAKHRAKITPDLQKNHKHKSFLKAEKEEDIKTFSHKTLFFTIHIFIFCLCNFLHIYCDMIHVGACKLLFFSTTLSFITEIFSSEHFLMIYEMLQRMKAMLMYVVKMSEKHSKS